jgi:hypothetical protein
VRPGPPYQVVDREPRWRDGRGATESAICPFGCSADNRQTTQTIPVAALVLIARFVEETLVDVPPVGQDNVGDSFLFTEDLFTQAGRAVGHDQVRCTLALHLRWCGVTRRPPRTVGRLWSVLGPTSDAKQA